MGNKNTILIIDDNEDSLLIINRILKRLGFNILNASSGKEGIRLVLKHNPDCILLDRNMPEMDGIAVCHKLKSMEETKRIPVILWTGANAKEDIIEGINAGADDFVNKAADNDILHVRIQAMLRMKNLNDELQNELDYSKNLIGFSKNINITQIEEIARILENNLEKLFGLETFSIFLYDMNFDLFKISAHNQKELQNKNILIERNQVSIMWEALDHKKPVLIKDFQNSIYAREKKLHRDNFAICFPLIINNRVIGILNMNNSKDGEFPDSLLQRATVPVDHLASSISNYRIYHKMEELSITDELTKLYNRRYLNKELDEEWTRAKRYNRSFVCIMIDIDHFKRVNDTYGHPFGDFILMELAIIFKKIVRDSDRLFRYGGEEFFILLPETSPDAGMNLAERLRAEVESHSFYHSETPLSLTISLGVAFFPANEIKRAKDLLKIADERLYEAKKLGRNMVIYDEKTD